MGSCFWLGQSPVGSAPFPTCPSVYTFGDGLPLPFRLAQSCRVPYSGLPVVLYVCIRVDLPYMLAVWRFSLPREGLSLCFCGLDALGYGVGPSVLARQAGLTECQVLCGTWRVF